MCLSEQTKLLVVDLSSNRLSDDTAPCLVALLRANELIELRLMNNDLGAASGESLGEVLKDYATLKVLDLAFNRIGSGARSIAAAFPTMPALQSVNVRV